MENALERFLDLSGAIGFAVCLCEDQIFILPIWIPAGLSLVLSFAVFHKDRPGRWTQFDGGVDLSEFGANVPQDVIDAVMEVRQMFIDGGNPFVGPIYDNTGAIAVAEGESLVSRLFRT